MTEGDSKQGAGFIIFKAANPELVLVLIRSDGQYDIPKGVVDTGESDIMAAKRETFEECSIFIEPKEMLAPMPSLKDEQLATYAAITGKIPQITPNPHSGIWEHEGYEWVTKDKAVANCLPYLVRHIEAGYFLKRICLL